MLTSMSKKSDDTKYSEVMGQFDKLNVSEFTLDLGSGELKYRLKTEDKNSKTDNKEGATTTTKSASNDNDSKQKQPQEQQKPQSTQAQPRTTQATAKATVKPVQTTKATTKATQKQNSTIDISKLSKLQQALYRMSTSNGSYNKQDLEIVRSEFLAYGKSLYPQFQISTKLHPMIDNNGKYTDSFSNGGVNSSTEYYTVLLFGTAAYKSEQHRLNDLAYFENAFKTIIKNTLQDSTRFDPSDTIWYITYGREDGNQLSWVCMTAFPQDWK